MLFIGNQEKENQMKLCIFTEPEKAEPVVFVKLESFLGDLIHLVLL